MGSRLVGPNMSDSKSQKAHWQIERNKHRHAVGASGGHYRNEPRLRAASRTEGLGVGGGLHSITQNCQCVRKTNKCNYANDVLMCPACKCTCICIFVCVYVYVVFYKHVYVHVHVYAYVYVYVCMYVCMHVGVYVRT